MNYTLWYSFLFSLRDFSFYPFRRTISATHSHPRFHSVWRWILLRWSWDEDYMLMDIRTDLIFPGSSQCDASQKHLLHIYRPKHIVHRYLHVFSQFSLYVWNCHVPYIFVGPCGASPCRFIIIKSRSCLFTLDRSHVVRCKMRPLFLSFHWCEFLPLYNPVSRSAIFRSAPSSGSPTEIPWQVPFTSVSTFYALAV